MNPPSAALLAAQQAAHSPTPSYIGRRGPRRYVITNQKGGQGKTSSAINLGAEFAALGRRVRVIDCDPQMGSATYWLPPQIDDATPPPLRYDLIHVLMAQASLDQATWPTTVPGLSIIPSYHTLAQFETMPPPGADLVLRQAIDVAEPFDVTLVDCPPNLGRLTVTAITSADDVIVPCKPGGLDLAGVADLSQTLQLVKARLSPALRVTAVVICDKQASNFTDAVERQLMEDYPDAVHQAIRHTVRVGEAPTVHQALRDYAPRSTAARDYQSLAEKLNAGVLAGA